jgi:hypothetical protein
MKTRNTIITMAVAAAALGASAAPAMAAGHASFVVQDRGGALVTTQSVTVGQQIYTGGISYTVATAQSIGGSVAITLSQRLPGSDNGKALIFTT